MKKLLMLSAATLLCSAAPAFAAKTAKTPAATPPAAAAPATSTPTPAAPAGAGSLGAFGDMADANHDGVLTKEEFLAAQEKRFAEMDTNGDGKVTREELDAKRQAWMQAMKERHDKMMQEHADQSKGAAPDAKKADATKPDATKAAQ